jgi:hypothetical protein
MKRSLLLVVSFVAATLTLGVAPAALALEVTDGTIELIPAVTPEAIEIVCCVGPIFPVFHPAPIPAPPTLILEGTIFNKRSGRPVQGALVYRAFPTGHPGFDVAPALATSEVAPAAVIDMDLTIALPFVLTAGSDQNGLYSTTANGAQYGGVMAYCVYQRRDGSDKLVTSSATLPSGAYTPYLRRDMYLNLPKYISKCDSVLTFQLFLADQGI